MQEAKNYTSMQNLKFPCKHEWVVAIWVKKFTFTPSFKTFVNFRVTFRVTLNDKICHFLDKITTLLVYYFCHQKITFLVDASTR